MAEGLPEIQGGTNGGVTYGEQQNGALYTPSNKTYSVQAPPVDAGSLKTCSGYIFQASKYDPIYGSSTTVTPKSLKTGWCIKY